MNEDRCPCKHNRLLARYEPGASAVGLLAPKASVTVTVDMNVVNREGAAPGVVKVGSARCQRRLCKLLGRNRP